MLVPLLVLLAIVVLLGGGGIFLHLIWIVAIIALIVWAIGFLFRGSGHWFRL